MELKVSKDSFIQEFKKIRKFENVAPKDRSQGFMYLHNSTTKRLAEGGCIEFTEIDFTKFTNEDLEEYMNYYSEVIEPKVCAINKLYEILRKAESVFSPKKSYF